MLYFLSSTFLHQRFVSSLTPLDLQFLFWPPQDASWLLPSSSPLKCTSPADVYLLLKASDFVNHDLLVENVFEGCDDANEDPAFHEPEYKLELVLRKWYPVDRGRELRCFVRENILLGKGSLFPYIDTGFYTLSGFSQRDTNYYEFWNQEETNMKVTSTVEEFWAQNIRDKWSGQQDCLYIFLVYFTQSLDSYLLFTFQTSSISF